MAAESTSGKRLLVVDDTSKIRQTIREVLSYEGIEVIEASDDNEAYGVLAGDPTLDVVSDVQMPNSSGDYNNGLGMVATHMAALKATGRLIAMTASGYPAPSNLAYPLSGQLAKPFMATDILPLLES